MRINDNPEIDIYLGDCFEIMKEIEDKSIDLILTDPPYGVRKKENWDNRKNFVDYINLWLEEHFRISNIIIWFCSDKMLPFIIGGKTNFHRLLIWNKPSGTQFAGAMNNNLWYSIELILIFGNETIIKTKGKNSLYEYSSFDARTISFVQYNHPTVKPLILMKWLMRHYSNENDIVFDGFMGSGTTGVASKQLNRRFIGIEKEEKYFDIAKERIINTKVNRELFKEIKQNEPNRQTQQILSA